MSLVFVYQILQTRVPEDPKDCGCHVCMVTRRFIRGHATLTRWNLHIQLSSDGGGTMQPASAAAAGCWLDALCFAVNECASEHMGWDCSLLP